MIIRNKFVPLVFFLCFLIVTLIIASPSEIVEPARNTFENKKNENLNIISNIMLITGITGAAAGLIPVFHGLSWLDSPQNFGIPIGEVIVGCGIELVSTGFIVTGALLKRRVRLQQMPVKFNFQGNGICFTYNFDFNKDR